MARPPAKPPEDKTRIVLAVLGNEVTVAEAARREGVSQTTVAKWRDQFLEAGTAAMTSPGRAGPSGREQTLEAELDQVKIALGETTAELRAWKKGGRSWWQTHSSST